MTAEEARRITRESREAERLAKVASRQRYEQWLTERSEQLLQVVLVAVKEAAQKGISWCMWQTASGGDKVVLEHIVTRLKSLGYHAEVRPEFLSINITWTSDT